jgi:hypothetical protein
MKWQFNVPNGSTNITLNAEIICTTHQMEQIKITGKNISITVLGNRPLIEAIERPWHIPLSWRLIQGELADTVLLDSITKSVEQHVKQSPSKKNVNMFSEVRKTA